MKNKCNIAPINPSDIKSRMLVLRNQAVLLDRDVAAAYQVETREINQAVRNNPDKFPEGFVWELEGEELETLRSKILTLDQRSGRGHHSKHGYKVFTERGLYMLATILKGKVATRATLAIINTYAQVRAMVSDMEALQTKKDGSPEQTGLLARIGEKFAELIDDNLTTKTVETEIELNLSMIKIRRKITRTKRIKK